MVIWGILCILSLLRKFSSPLFHLSDSDTFIFQKKPKSKDKEKGNECIQEITIVGNEFIEFVFVFFLHVSGGNGWDVIIVRFINCFKISLPDYCILNSQHLASQQLSH